MDNYFSGDRIYNWIGQKGLGANMTCRRDRLLPGVTCMLWRMSKIYSSIGAWILLWNHTIAALESMIEGEHWTEQWMFVPYF